MSHPEKDELIFIYSSKFSAGVCGSPFGEVKQFIHTPSIKLVNLDYYDEEKWDYVYIDNKFSLDEYLYIQNRYDRVIRRLPLWLRKNID